MRILLVRLDGVGDAAVCVPLIAALRAAGHEVGVALTTRNAGVFAPHAILTQHVLERIPWPAHGSTPASTARATAEIAAMRYDVALIASEEPEAFALAQGIPERVGFTTGVARPLKTLWVRGRTTRTVSRSQRLGTDDAHEVEVLYRLGAGLVHDERPPTDRSRLQMQLLEGANVVTTRSPDPGGGSSIITTQVGPKWLEAGVAPETLRTVVTRLARYGRIVAAPSEAEEMQRLTGVMPQTFASTRAWVEMLAGSATVVTVDTGAAHVAGMSWGRVIDVFPDAGFEAQVRRWRPWAAPYRAFRASEVDGGAQSRFIEAILDDL
jgi:ADP-heptose:LPS heptosyltransferase